MSCSYPVRDRNLVVSENYLRSLQHQINAGNSHPAIQLDQHTPGQGPGSGLHDPVYHVDSSLGAHEQRSTAVPVLKDTTAEAFVSGLKRLGATDSAGSPPAPGPPNNIWKVQGSDGHSDDSQHDYIPLDFDTSTSRVTIKLPPYPYAVQLVNQFETFLGYEYHWYLRNSYHAGLESTYRNPHSAESKDRIWLCKLLTVFALGESYNSYNTPSIELVDDTRHRGHGSLEAVTTRPQSPPGVGFFEQALTLFKVAAEEPTVAHVEALNLIAFYCYSLNRRKTAYIYSGLAVRIASCLMLHQPAVGKAPSVAEHHKRIWWTTFQLDAMTSAEVGLRPTLCFADAQLALPADELLSHQDRMDFHDAQILAAHLKLCGIRSDIADVVGRLQQEDFTNYRQVVQLPLGRLEQWRLELPAHCSFEFSQGIPPAMLSLPSMRSLTSVYLRYHQGYIILMRPVFLMLLATALGKSSNERSLDSMIDFSSRCLEAAKCNMRIFVSLSEADRIAKYGFWESLHIFSSVNVFSLARLARTFRPLSLYPDSVDLSLYASAKDLLVSMATQGNVASKGHIKLIEETERLLDAVLSSQDQGGGTMMDLEHDIFQWFESIDDVDNLEPTWPSVFSS